MISKSHPALLFSRFHLVGVGDDIFRVGGRPQLALRSPVWTPGLAKSGLHCLPPGVAGTWAPDPMASSVTKQLLSGGKSRDLNDLSLGIASDSPLQLVTQAMLLWVSVCKTSLVKRGKWLRIRCSVSRPVTHHLHGLGQITELLWAAIIRELAHIWVS